MKVNISIELTDEQRSLLADVIDGKINKRLATRKEVRELCQRHMGGLVRSNLAAKTGEDRIGPNLPPSDLYSIDPGDRELMGQPDNPHYVRGWNIVKRGYAL